MDTGYVQTLYKYNRWANGQTLESVARLSAEEFTKERGGSFSSIRDTLCHILSAERVWLSRWKGHSPSQRLNPREFPTVASLQTQWAAQDKEMDDFLRGLTNERLQTVIRYTNMQQQSSAQPLWQQMAHLVNHSSYHRGQITCLLRQAGAQPVSTDLIVFFRNQPSQP